MIVHLYNLVGSHCIVPPCSFLWNLVFWYIPPWSGYNCPVENWGDTSWLQCFSNRCPLIIRCLEMARAYNSMFTYLQLTVISIEFSLCTHVYVDSHNNIFICCLYVCGISCIFGHLSVIRVKSDNDSTYTMLKVIEKFRQIYVVCR